MLISRSTIRLLRVPFSFFLMPVYFFALSQTTEILWWKAGLIFVILHAFLYPASNGYNSYMDRDQGSIGLLEHPPLPTRELFWVTLWLDLIGLALSVWIGPFFFICVLANIAASRAYSYRGIRLKRFPVVGFLTVILFQGAVTFLMVLEGSGRTMSLPLPWLPALASSLLFGCFYPLTQIYQHQQDYSDGVVSLSYRLGYGGTFAFTAAMFLAGDLLLGLYFRDHILSFLILELALCPVAVYFFMWFLQVRRDAAMADYRHTMRMNVLGACATNAAFFTLLILNHI